MIKQSRQGAEGWALHVSGEKHLDAGKSKCKVPGAGHCRGCSLNRERPGVWKQSERRGGGEGRNPGTRLQALVSHCADIAPTLMSQESSAQGNDVALGCGNCVEDQLQEEERRSKEAITMMIREEEMVVAGTPEVSVEVTSSAQTVDIIWGCNPQDLPGGCWAEVHCESKRTGDGSPASGWSTQGAKGRGCHLLSGKGCQKGEGGARGRAGQGPADPWREHVDAVFRSFSFSLQNKNQDGGRKWGWGEGLGVEEREGMKEASWNAGEWMGLESVTGCGAAQGLTWGQLSRDPLYLPEPFPACALPTPSSSEQTTALGYFAGYCL